MFSNSWNKRFGILLTAVLVASLAVVAGAAVFTSPAMAQEVEGSSVPAKTAHRVHVVQMTRLLTYEPKMIVVNVGDTVEWVNKDLYVHTVTSVDGKSFDSGNIYPKRSWRYKAVKKGTYSYFCTPHPDMKGELIVR